MVRAVAGLFLSMALIAPAQARAQVFQVHGSGGPTITDEGYSVAAGVGIGVTPRVAFDVNVERTYLSPQVTRDSNGVISTFRGGDLTLGSARLRVSLFDRSRIGPYGLVGFAAGISRPTVNAMFPNRVRNDVRAAFIGGGIHVPIGDRVSAFADARMMAGAEGLEGIVAVAPVRAGLVFRF